MKIALFSLTVIILIGAIIIVPGCSSFGTRPSPDDRARFESSPQYHKNDSQFVNRRPKILDEIKKRIKFSDYIDAVFSNTEEKTPSRKLPDVKTNLSEFLATSQNIKVVWFGHSSVMLNLGGKVILLDPIFSERASPFFFGSKRFQNPALSLQELPQIDFIVISHDHYDHLDMKTVQFFKDKNTEFVVPLGIAADLMGWGIKKDKIVELDWWKNHIADGIEFISTPAQHSSGRDRIHFNETLWSSWVIRNGKQAVYFSGDSGYDTHFKEIGARLGPFDLALIENGQYNEKWHESHLLPDETILAFKDLKAKVLLPIHWAMFSLAPHKWFDPIVEVSARAKKENIHIITPLLGELVELTDNYESSAWWNDLMTKNSGPSRTKE